MTKPHLIIRGGRVLQFDDRFIALVWVQTFGHLGNVPAYDNPKTFREWKERKTANTRYTVKVKGVRRANEALVLNRLLAGLFKDILLCAK